MDYPILTACVAIWTNNRPRKSSAAGAYAVHYSVDGKKWKTIWGAGYARYDEILRAGAAAQILKQLPKNQKLKVLSNSPGLEDRLKEWVKKSNDLEKASANDDFKIFGPLIEDYVAGRITFQVIAKNQIPPVFYQAAKTMVEGPAKAAALRNQPKHSLFQETAPRNFILETNEGPTLPLEPRPNKNAT